jgi:hypothetical protein
MQPGLSSLVMSFSMKKGRLAPNAARGIWTSHCSVHLARRPLPRQLRQTSSRTYLHLHLLRLPHSLHRHVTRPRFRLPCRLTVLHASRPISRCPLLRVWHRRRWTLFSLPWTCSVVRRPRPRRCASRHQSPSFTTLPRHESPFQRSTSRLPSSSTPPRAWKLSLCSLLPEVP